MKQVFCYLTFCCLLGISCQKEATITKSASNQTNTAQPNRISSTSHLINIDVANNHIQSYLDGLDATAIPQIKAFFIDAATLRNYLQDSSITELKLMFGHTSSVLAAGGLDTFVYLNQGALTAFIVGVDANQNYVYKDDELLINNMQGCPYNCKTIGTASSDLLTRLTP